MLSRDPISTSNVFGALNGRSVSASPSAEAPTPVHLDTSGDAKKKKNKKKKAASSSSASVDQDTNHETVQLPLARRLEVAAGHADLHAALVGLVGWSRLVVHTDAILAFFQSNALRLLLVKVLTVRPKQDVVYENLVTLLANCLSVVHDGKSVTSNRLTAVAVVDALRAIMANLPANTDVNADSDEDKATAEAIAEYLSTMVLKHRMSLSGITHESTLSNDVLQIETQLKAAATKDSEVTGQTIRDSFQRRDIRSDAMTLYESRLEMIMQIVRETATRSKNEDDSSAGGFLAIAEAGSDAKVNDDEVAAVKARVAQLEEEKNTKLEAFDEKKKTREDKLLLLQKERDELEAKLRAVNAQIQDVLSEQEQLELETKAIDEAFSTAKCRIDEQHHRVLHAHQRQESRRQVHAEFVKLKAAIASISQAHRDTQSLLDKHATCLRQQLEGALRYLGSELPCVKFMVKRIEDNQAEVQKLTQEASSYEALGVHAVSSELVDKVKAMRLHLDEDQQCVKALRKRDMEVVAMMERILNDGIHEKALKELDENIKKEARRHIEYVQKVHADAESFLIVCSSGDNASLATKS